MDFAFVRRVNAGKNPAERAFARAVLADERVAIAALNVKAYTVQREHAGEAFGNVFEGEKRHFVFVRERAKCRENLFVSLACSACVRQLLSQPSGPIGRDAIDSGRHEFPGFGR